MGHSLYERPGWIEQHLLFFLLLLLLLNKEDKRRREEKKIIVIVMMMCCSSIITVYIIVVECNDEMRWWYNYDERILILRIASLYEEMMSCVFVCILISYVTTQQRTIIKS